VPEGTDDPASLKAAFFAIDQLDSADYSPAGSFTLKSNGWTVKNQGGAKCNLFCAATYVQGAGVGLVGSGYPVGSHGVIAGILGQSMSLLRSQPPVGLHAGDRLPEVQAMKVNPKIWKMTLALGVLITCLIIGASAMTRSHWWKRQGAATVTYNRETSAGASVYRSPDGSLLLDLRTQGDLLYLVRTKTAEIGVPLSSNFIMLPFYVYSREINPPAAPLQKLDIRASLVIDNRTVEFNSFNGGRVRVELP